MTRQFLAVNKKVINRGDSVRRRERPTFKKSSTEGQLSSLSGGFFNINYFPPKCRLIHVLAPPKDVSVTSFTDDPPTIYRVAFVGSAGVGKTSIINQFLSSEHSDVYEDDGEGGDRSSGHMSARYC